jgi:basic amino acid/polyamine antiporter, APA family
VEKLSGPSMARVWSAVVIVLFTSALSAMIMIGPRVYAAMARDGFLPRALQGSDGRPPVASALLQGAISLLIVFTHPLRQALSNVGAILTLFAALTALCLFRVRFSGRKDLPMPPVNALLAAGVFVLSAGLILYFGFKGEVVALIDEGKPPTLMIWIAVVIAVALLGYAVTRALRQKPV